MFRRPRGLTRETLLCAVPHLNPVVQWRELDTGEWVATFQKDLGWLARLVRKVFLIPELGQVLVDVQGAAVLRRIDGERTIRALAGYVAEEFAMKPEAAEASVLKYLNMLAEKRLVGFALPVGPGTETECSTRGTNAE